MTQTLLKLSRSLTGGLSREAFAAIADTVHRLVGNSTAVAVWELRDDKMTAICHIGFGADGREIAGANHRELFPGLVIESQKSVAIDNVSLRPELKLVRGKAGERFPAMLGAPLKMGGDIVGALVIYSPRVRGWTGNDVSLVESLAAQASVSIATAKLLEQIENDHRQLQTILDTVPFAIVRMDAKTSRLICNPAGCALLALPQVVEQGPEHWPNAKLIGPSGEIARGGDPLMRALRGEVTTAMELEVHLPDGRKITTLCNAAPILDRSGVISGAIGAFVDVSAQKSLREELDAKRRDAEAASIRKSRFLAAVSHDIRTPANAVSLLAELIRRTANDPAQAGEIPEIAKDLERSSISLVNLVSDVLDLARLDLGHLELRKSEFDFSNWLMDHGRQLRPLAEKKHLEFVCDPPQAGIRLHPDRIKLSRVLTNLIGNAIKYTEKGQVHVSAGLLPDRRPRVIVGDSGIGIAPENLAVIFDEFAQLKNPDRVKSSGSGLGLSICKRLVELMGGTLEVVSPPAREARFPSRCRRHASSNDGAHPMKPASVAFRVIGEFNRPDVIARWVDRPRPRNIEIDRHIERAWQQAQSRPGIELFDGPMCRLERFHAGKRLELELSPTSYKAFLGTNLTNSRLADQYGPDALANPVGLSCAWKVPMDI